VSSDYARFVQAILILGICASDPVIDRGM